MIDLKRSLLSFSFVVFVLPSLGCSAVKMQRVRDDYAAEDRQKTKRLLVSVAPAPANDEQVRELWRVLARRYVNQKRNFLVRERPEETAGAESAAAFDPISLCPTSENLEGVLHLEPNVRREGDGVEGSVLARLLRCRDGVEVWAALAEASFRSEDDDLKAVTEQYTEALGAELTPFVAPSFRLLKAVLDTLPEPALSDEDVDEKIELGE